MDRPAASSAAELIRLPVESVSIAFDMATPFCTIAACVRSDATLVLITLIIVFLPWVVLDQRKGDFAHRQKDHRCFLRESDNGSAFYFFSFNYDFYSYWLMKS